jgi:hypothetical protein
VFHVGGCILNGCRDNMLLIRSFVSLLLGLCYSEFQVWSIVRCHDFLVEVYLLECRFQVLDAYLDFFLFLVYFQRGYVEAHVDDGLLEIFGLKQGWHASFVMVELISAKHIAQVLHLIQNCLLFMLLCQVLTIQMLMYSLRIWH